MMLCGLPLPERPQSRDEADDRGFDPESATWDRVPPEPLGETWQAYLDGAVTAAKHRRDADGDDRCGTRCWTCDDRMCAIDGPEPRACGVTCVECRCDCTACQRTKDDLHAEVVRMIERDTR